MVESRLRAEGQEGVSYTKVRRGTFLVQLTPRAKGTSRKTRGRNELQITEHLSVWGSTHTLLLVIVLLYQLFTY